MLLAWFSVIAPEVLIPIHSLEIFWKVMKMKKHNEGILLISQLGEELIFFFFWQSLKSTEEYMSIGFNTNKR